MSSNLKITGLVLLLLSNVGFGAEEKKPAPVATAKPQEAAKAAVPITTVPAANAPVKKPEATAATTSQPATAAKKEAVAVSVPATKEPKARKPHSEVTKVDRKGDRVGITEHPTHGWNRKDPMCVYRQGRAVACGKIIAVAVKGAVAQLESHDTNILEGDEVRFIGEVSRGPASIPESELETESMLETKPFRWNIALGFNLGLDFRYPMGSISYAVSPSVAIGVMPAYLYSKGTDNIATLVGFGGLLTINYFGQEYFRGFWMQLGSGFYKLTATGASSAENLNAPIITLLLGWREDWAHGLNIGVGIGGRFISPLSGTIPELAYQSLYPVASVDLGLSF